MKRLILALAIVSEAIAFLVVGDAYDAFRWPPPHNIGPLWGAPFASSCAALLFSGTYLWFHTRSSHSRRSYIFPIAIVCFAMLCFGLVFYYPVAYDQVSSAHAAHIRANLDQLVKQHEQ